MKTIFYLTLIFFFFGCSDGKYKMYDMAFDKYIIIDDLIESGEYTPEICEKRIDRIFKTKPPTINPNLSGQLNNLLDKWADEEESFRLKKGDSTRFSHSNDNIIKATKYAYTYFLNEKPMHVFSTCINVVHLKEMDWTTLFIRVDNEGNIIGGFNDHHLVQNSCDKKIKCLDL